MPEDKGWPPQAPEADAASPKPRISIRPAAGADLDFIINANVALARETENVTLDAGVLRAGVRALLEDRAPGRYWIAEHDGRRIGQTLITFEWSDWRNRMVWWIQSVYVLPADRGKGAFRALYAHVRREAQASGAGGLRLYVDNTNTRGQQVYRALGMNGDHYRVFEDMF
jgi:GNAT superfamily N-acetyltransferase